MQKLLSLLNENLIFINMNVSTNKEAIERMSQKMSEYGYVKESFQKAVLQREANYPTGLETNVTGVAIPHTDAVHVIKEAIAIGVLDSPVKFNMMGMNDQTVNVEIIFLLAISETHGQLQALQELMSLFQSPTSLKKLKEAKSAREIIETIKNI